jgi:endonuclease YncB( thermonuclease family)
MRTKHLTTAWLFLLAGVAAISTAAAPPVPPSPGLCVWMEYVKTRDGDTIEARLPGSAFVFALRLFEVWSPETDSRDSEQKRIALAGKAFVQKKCEGKMLLVYVPFTQSVYPLKALTFDRVPSFVWVEGDKTSLNVQVVAGGFASTDKGGALGK